jgi:hypothetical protein
MKHLNISYGDLMTMPTYERRFYIDMFKNEMEMRKEHIEEAKNNAKSGGKGSRSSKVSGEALKSRLKNNQIPQE